MIKRILLFTVLSFALCSGFAQFIKPFAGNGTCCIGGDGGNAENAKLFTPGGIALDRYGNMFIADKNNSRIRKVTITDTIITTIAGITVMPNGSGGYNGDEIPAASALLSSPTDVDVDSTGNIYIADHYNSRIRMIDTAGIIHTIAGTETPGYDGDGGPAVNARIYWPTGVKADNHGNIYFTDTYNNVIRKIDANGIIITIAGNGTAGFDGDGGPATAALLNTPTGIDIDAAGNIYFCDTYNQRIRKISTNGTISTIAGITGYGYNGDNIAATTALLKYPQGISADKQGNIYIADTDNERVRKIDSTGKIFTVAGNGYNNFTGDWGLAVAASLSAPADMVVNNKGVLFISDAVNSRIRQVGPIEPVEMCDSGSAAIKSNLNGVVTYYWQMNSGSGYGDIPFNSPNFSGIMSQTLQMINIPNSWYGRSFRCRSENNRFSREFTITFSNKWTGTSDHLWSNPANWSCGKVPDANTDVIIKSGTVILDMDATVRSMRLDPAVDFSIVAGFDLIILH